MGVDGLPAVDRALAARVVARHVPHLAHLPLGDPFTGYRSTGFRLGEDRAVRFPTGALGVAQLERIARSLPVVVPHLPVPVPAIEVLVPAGDEFPVPWAVTAWVDGAPLLADPPTAATARDLGAALRALHAAPAADGVPPNQWARPLDAWTPAVLARLDQVAAMLGRGFRHRRARALWAAAVAAPGPASAGWVHGDLTPMNLVQRDGRLAGLLDWGEVGVGDPAVDIGHAWSLVAADDLALLLDAYGPLDRATRTRARGVAVLKCAAYAASTDPALAALGRRGLATLGLLGRRRPRAPAPTRERPAREGRGALVGSAWQVRDSNPRSSRN